MIQSSDSKPPHEGADVRRGGQEGGPLGRRWPAHDRRAVDDLISQQLLAIHFKAEDLVTVRAQAREAGELAGLETVQQTRFATAVSEIARNAVQYAREGTVTFSVARESDTPSALLMAHIVDRGPGIENLDSVLAGEGTTPDGRASMGIAGSKRLVDRFTVDCPTDGGTQVRLEMVLPPNVSPLDPDHLTRVAERLASRQAHCAQAELDRQNRELLRTMQELRDKQLALEKADEMKNQFITTLAHELRNPLSTLDMSLELMRRRPNATPAEVGQRREVMARQAGQMIKLVDDLMDMARIRQGKVKLNKVRVEMNTLVTHAVEMTGAAIAGKSHTVSVDADRDPLWVIGDSSRLTQVLCNLLQNSARYTPPGGTIEVKMRREDAFAVIEVADNGMGIAPDVLPTIFGLFVQGSGAAGEPSERGLGLGLALVHRLVAEHGGTVGVRSDGHGKGSCFSVRLPRTEAPPAAPDGSDAGRLSGLGQPCATMRA